MGACFCVLAIHPQLDTINSIIWGHSLSIGLSSREAPWTFLWQSNLWWSVRSASQREKRCGRNMSAAHFCSLLWFGFACLLPISNAITIFPDLLFGRKSRKRFNFKSECRGAILMFSENCYFLQISAPIYGKLEWYNMLFDFISHSLITQQVQTVGWICV